MPTSTSFPSGHASTAIQVAAVVAHHVNWWPADVALYGTAAAVAYQRVATEKHWASDVFLGAAWGWGVAQVVMRRRELLRSEVVPILDPATGALGLRIPVHF